MRFIVLYDPFVKKIDIKAWLNIYTSIPVYLYTSIMSSASRAQSKVTVANLDLSKLRYSKVTIPKSGLGKYITVQYDYGKDGGVKPLSLEFPLMFSWGANRDDREHEGQAPKDKYNLAVQFPRDSDIAQQTDEMKATFQKLIDLEERLLEDATNNAKDWGITDRSGKALQVSLGHPLASGAILKWPLDKKTKMIVKDDPDRKPTVQMKLSVTDDRMQCSVFNEAKKMIYCPQNKAGTIAPEICDIDKNEFLELIPKFSNVKCIASLTVWFQGGSVMPSLTVQQVLCYKPQNTRVELSECLFDGGLSEEEQARADIASAVAAKDNDDDAPQMAQASIVDDSDDEADIVIPDAKPKAPVAAAPEPKKGVVVPPKAPPAAAADDDVSDEEEEAAPLVKPAAKPAAGKKVVVSKKK